MAKSDKQAWQDLVELKKQRQGLEEAPQRQEQEAVKPVGFKAKWKNYWYHHKAATWITVSVVAVLAVGVVDFVNRPKYDMTVIMPTADFIPMKETELLEQRLNELAPDVNKNGETLVNFITLPGVGNDMAASQKLLGMIGAAEFSFMIVDDATFEQVFAKQEGILVNLAQRYPGDPHITEDGLRWKLEDTSLTKDMPDKTPANDLYVCLRELKDAPVLDKASTQKIMDSALQIMDALHKANATGTK